MPIAGWSVNPKPSNPAASAAAATVAMPDPVTNSGLYGWLCIGWVNVNFIKEPRFRTFFSFSENVVTMRTTESTAFPH